MSQRVAGVGNCQLLGVPVESGWKACSFASPPFKTSLTKLENILQLETSISLVSAERIVEPLVNNVESNSPQMAMPKKE